MDYTTTLLTGFVALYIFMLAAFTGFEIIGRVPAILHTPLMSGSNFIHGIVQRAKPVGQTVIDGLLAIKCFTGKYGSIFRDLVAS